EIAPAVKDAVATARQDFGATSPPTATDRNRLASRLPEIDYDAIPAALAKDAIEPGDNNFEDVRHSYIWPGKPGLVLTPHSAEEVSQAVLYARQQDAPMTVRSGGHGIAGRSTNDG